MLGFGAFSVPQRRDAPTAAAPVESPFADWGGSASAWEQDWQRRYNEEAAKARPSRGAEIQLVAGAPGYDATTAAPYVSEIRNYWNDAFDSQFGRSAAAAPAAEYDSLRNMWTNAHMRTYLDSSSNYDRGSHLVRTPDYDPGYMPNFTALEQEKAKLGPLAEPQMRQQQAYDWMEGAHQQNAIMSPEYANAGFNTITGMSNPYAGPGQIDGVSMDWAQGVYDPTTQRATGTYNPTNYSKNTGW